MPEDLELLQGSWTVTALEVDGQSMPAVALAGAEIVIKGSRFTSTGMGAVYKGTLELNTATKPRQLDMKFDAGPEKGNTNLCIYELQGDSWKLCIATRGITRPVRFATTPGSGFAFETLARCGVEEGVERKPKASVQTTAETAPGPPPTQFEGEWHMISGIMNGVPMDESHVKWVKRVTRGNQTTVLAGEHVMLKVEFTTDCLKSPAIIDYLNLAGSNKGKVQHGIFAFDGDLLKVCVAAPGAERPMEFHSTPGDGCTLTLWKRP